MRANEPNPDPNTGVLVASATLLGLYAQQRYGVGQQIFVNMLTANAYANADDFIRYEGKQPRRQVDGELYGISALYRLYPTEQGWVFLAAPTDAEWARFCAHAHPELADDPRFGSVAARDEHDAALVDVLTDVFATRPAAEWEALLTHAADRLRRGRRGDGGAVLRHDPQMLENDFAPLARHQRMGELRRWGPLTHMAGGRDDYGPGVLAGAETDAILREIGRSDEEIAELRSNRVVWAEPVEIPT